MDKTIHLKHQKIYDRIENLRQFIANDVIAQNDKYYDEIDDLLSQMSSRSNTKLKEISTLNRQRTKHEANMFLKLLTYMDESTKRMEEKDIQLGDDINKGDIT